MKKTTQSIFGIMGLALFSGASTASADVEALLGSDISGEISAGWDGRYFFRGLWFGDETAWTNIEISKEVCETITASMNVFYTEVTDETFGGAGFSYSEANVGLTLSYDAGFGTFDLGFLHYRFFDGFAGSAGGLRAPAAAGAANNGDATEISLTYSQDIAYGIGFHATVAHDFRIDGTYAEIGFAKSFALSDDVGLDFSVSTGYSIDNYYTVGSFNAPTGPNASNYDFTHTLISLALPIQLTETASLTPHVTANLSHDARDAINSGVNRGDSEVYFGASFAVSF